MAVNQHVNKVILNGTTLMDVSDNTITDEDMMEGVTATMPDGSVKSGKMRLDDIETQLNTIEGKIDNISSGGSGGSFVELGDVTGVTLESIFSSANKGVSIKWTDPSDVIINSGTFAKWAGTVIIRKEGSAPTNVNDGAVVINSTVRDHYKTSGFIDVPPDFTKEYYYRFFPYSETNVFTHGSSVLSNQVAPTWSTGTLDQIAYALNEDYAGRLDTYEDLGWRSGDRRKITLNKVTSGNYTFFPGGDYYLTLLQNKPANRESYEKGTTARWAVMFDSISAFTISSNSSLNHSDYTYSNSESPFHMNVSLSTLYSNRETTIYNDVSYGLNKKMYDAMPSEYFTKGILKKYKYKLIMAETWRPSSGAGYISGGSSSSTSGTRTRYFIKDNMHRTYDYFTLPNAMEVCNVTFADASLFSSITPNAEYFLDIYNNNSSSDVTAIKTAYQNFKQFDFFKNFPSYRNKMTYALGNVWMKTPSGYGSSGYILLPTTNGVTDYGFGDGGFSSNNPTTAFTGGYLNNSTNCKAWAGALMII